MQLKALNYDPALSKRFRIATKKTRVLKTLAASPPEGHCRVFFLKINAGGKSFMILIRMLACIGEYITGHYGVWTNFPSYKNRR